MAIHSRGMICVLTQEESDVWKKTNTKPDCRGHRHVSLSTAVRWREWPRSNCFIAVEWAGRNAIWVEREQSPMLWTTVYVERGESGGPGMPVRQLVRGPAPIVNAGSIKGGIPASGARGRKQSVLKINEQVAAK